MGIKEPEVPKELKEASTLNRGSYILLRFLKFK